MSAGSNWTGRTPRTLVQAFGAYTGRELYEPSVRLTPLGRFLRAAAVLALFALMGVLMAWRG